MTEQEGKRSAKAGPSDGRWILIGLFACAFAVVIAAAYFYVQLGGMLGVEWQKRSLLGDALAPVAALLNAIALFAALWSVHLQRVELRENRDVMKEHSDHAEASAKAQNALLEAQAKANRIAVNAQRLQGALQVTQLKVELAKLRINRADKLYSMVNTSTVQAIDKEIETLEQEAAGWMKSRIPAARQVSDSTDQKGGDDE